MARLEEESDDRQDESEAPPQTPNKGGKDKATKITPKKRKAVEESAGDNGGSHKVTGKCVEIEDEDKA